MTFKPSAEQLAQLRLPRIVALVGPPAVGKSSLARQLVQPLHGEVFNLRTFARTRRAQPLPLQPGADPRGEYQDAVTNELLRAAIVHDEIGASGRPLITVDLPSTPTQVLLLHEVARARDLPVTVLELDADNGQLMAHAYHRRLCLACLPDPDGYPHDLAYPDATMPFRCDTCHGPLSIRRSDQPATFLARLTRYREQRPNLLAAADLAGIDWTMVYATTPSANLAMALRLLTVTDPRELAVRDRQAADGIPRQRR